jgi:hypothetical protein
MIEDFDPEIGDLIIIGFAGCAPFLLSSKKLMTTRHHDATQYEGYICQYFGSLLIFFLFLFEKHDIII